MGGWSELMPCNMNHRLLAVAVKEDIREAGGTPHEFGTIAVSDSVLMGTLGIRMSLVSREVIADSIEIVGRGHGLDGLVCIVGCDKTIPAGIIALLRLDVPGLVLYSGSMVPGHWRDRDVTIQEVFEAVGLHATGGLSDEDLHALEGAACPGLGTCAGQYTANTMAAASEFLGLSPAGVNDIPATDPAKVAAAQECGRLAVRLVHEGATPRSMVDRHALGERHGGRCRDWWLDQRSAPPLGDRQRSGSRVWPRRRSGRSRHCSAYTVNREPPSWGTVHGGGSSSCGWPTSARSTTP